MTCTTAFFIINTRREKGETMAKENWYDRSRATDVPKGPFMRLEGEQPVRIDRVADVRSRIKNGTYETEDKLKVAVDRLLDAFNR
jgi:anti-sigma28 factor (negative regulator of flagellin synthesis)